MSLSCPECGAAAPRGAVGGSAYACPGCGNPVLATEQPPRASRAAAPGEGPPGAAAPAAAPPAPRRTLGLALAAFVVLGAAYVGVFQLLTAEAQREVAEIERAHGADVVEARPPGPQPEASDAAGLRAWNAVRDRYELRTRHEMLSRRIDWFFRGMLAAFAAQTVLTAWVALKSLRLGSRRVDEVGGRARSAGRVPRRPVG